MSIHRILKPCLKGLRNIVNAVGGHEYLYLYHVPAHRWREERSRLRLWAANVGAHESDQYSLEFRLRDDSRILQEVISLLTDLRELLDEAKNDYLAVPNPPAQDLRDSFESLFKAVFTIIQGLYNLAMFINTAYKCDLRIRSFPKDIEAFKPFDEQHVRDKFPQADEQIVLRLGNAITRRRGYLKYRERHSQKLPGQGFGELENDLGSRLDTLAETEVSSVSSQHTPLDDVYADSDASQTSYAFSLVVTGPVTIPGPPKDTVFGKPFVCPYCCFIIKVRNTEKWHHHVLMDLQPYICTYERCRFSEMLYASRRSWWAHVCDSHDIMDLQCPLCEESFSTAIGFERHLARHLEGLALFALPRDEDSGKDHYDEDSSSDSDEAESYNVRDRDPHGAIRGISSYA
ncbi:MAG: hypothetical protein Q9220_006259 [cf. Caloplaca sp. 1 TL-2023]